MSEVTFEASDYLFTRLLLIEQEDAIAAMRVKLNEIQARRKQGTLTVFDIRDEDVIPVALKKLEKQREFLVKREITGRANTTPEEYAMALDAELAKRKEAAAKLTPSGAASQRIMNLERLKAMIGGDALAWRS